MNHSHAIVHFFEENFNEKKCHELCRKYKFIQRSSSKLKGYEFIHVMIIPSEGLSTESLKGLCKRMREINPEADLSAQALCERINSISSSKLMKGIFTELLHTLHQTVNGSCAKIAEGLKFFNRALIQDSTIISLNEKLEEDYKGTRRGNNGVKSQVKIDLIHDMSKGFIVDAKICGGNEPDQGLAGRIIKFIEPGDLAIRDLGYFAISNFLEIGNKHAYFLSRQKAGTNFYLNENDEEPLDLGKYLMGKELKNQNVIDLKGYLGREKISVRLIIYRQTQEVTNQRTRIANKQARKKGETLSKAKTLLLNFTVFITNAPVEMLSAEMVGTIYRLRWEIELIFKRWKSQLEIDYLKGIHRERIDCLIWSRLCTIIIIELITAHFKKSVGELFVVELSEVKLIQYLMRKSRLCTALAMNRLEIFFREMEKDISRMLLKDSRNQATMRERVFHKESYYGTQMTDNQYVA